ncbi:hypothetical protein SEUCBS139899_002420 [Sporothrix eucalyptigena]|uniref:Phosphatidylinositol-specific phospholipase C X domain-containing protein n=1 Tax=Sporothrix eucalyptigena TaxID=1812306 RepID=A0ABP0B1Z0_9PEZI
MALFPSVSPAVRPGRRPSVSCIPVGSCGSAGRRALLSIPLVILIGFILTTWFHVLDPIPGFEVAPLDIPAWQTNDVADKPPTAVTKGVDAVAGSAATETAVTVGFNMEEVDDGNEDEHHSPFSFDLAQILAAANASVYAEWMAGAPDDWPLSRLAIPGTHDTLTHRINLVGYRCQNSGLDEQLLAGVRYLDVRARVQVQPRTGGDDSADGYYEEDVKKVNPLGIYHASAYTGYEFADVAETVFAFLEAHPSEVVIMRLKEEALPINGSVLDPPGPAPWATANDAKGKSAIYSSPTPPFLQSWDHYRLDNPRTAPGLAKYMYRFNTTEDTHFDSPPPSKIPTMGQLRGKILILQEFPYFPESYLSAPPGTIPWYGIPWELSSDLLQIEDYWQTPDLKHLDNKWDAVRENLQAAAKNATAAENSDPAPLFLSHLSASVGVTPIDAAAGPTNHSVEGINDRTGRWLERGDDLAERSEDGLSRYDHYTPIGVAMADFPGRRLIDAILRRNNFLEFAE